MKKFLHRTLLALLVLGVAWAAYAWWAPNGLVTLNVRNMEVREVVRKIERQTRESINVHSNVQGKVTLNVRRMPLEDVLEIVGDQTESRWSSFYPLYSNGKSLGRLQQALRGELDPRYNGWTNLFGRSFGRDGRDGRDGFRGGPGGFGGGPGGFGGPFGGGPFGESARGTNRLVSLDIESKDVQFASLALNRFAQARVVPEDGASGVVTLRLNEVKIPAAVSQLAKKAHLSWKKLYTLTGFGFDRGRTEFASRERGRGERGPDSDGERRRFDRDSMTDEERDERRKQREALEEELKQTLPVAEQTKLAEQQQQREQLRQEMSNLTPEQMRERFSQMRGGGPGGGGFGGTDRRLNSIKNSTPEQRVDRYRRMEERRQRFQQGGGGGRGR